MPSELILASASPRRARILEALGVRFRQVRSGVEEVHDARDPQGGAVAAALQKARAVADAYPQFTVIGADTIVVVPEGTILGKPADREEAMRMLMLLSGRQHRVITGLAVVGPGFERTGAETTCVRIRTIAEEEARRYIRSGEPMDKAGAYGIQGRGGLLVERVAGCYFNVAGLPIRRLHEMLEAAGLGEDWLGPDRA